MHSIRLFLIASILATLTLFNFIAALQGYQSSMEEADTLFDNQLSDIAVLVANLNTDSVDSDILLDNNLTFQVWEQNELLTASQFAPTDPINDIAAGFDYANFDGYRWRTLSYSVPDLDRRVIVAERSDLRFSLAENVVLESVFPILIGIPLVGILIWTIVSFGLRPLKELSSELKDKQAHDLTPIHNENTARELNQVIESVNRFINRLSGVLEREKRFSADAAHELRTPISALKIQLHNLGEEIGTEHDSYRQLQDGVERMQHLIEQLLSLYRTTPERFVNNCKLVDLCEVTQNQVAAMYDSFEHKNQKLELSEGSAFIEGDQFALETLISNLLSNANKYTPQGGSINVHIRELLDEVELVVEDSGPGIPDEEKARIFERFYRMDSAQQADRAPGCGLGLTIVAHIAELHHAQIVIEDSGFATGSAFKVLLKKKV